MRSESPLVGVSLTIPGSDCRRHLTWRKIAPMTMDFADAAERLAGIGRRFDARGWVLGTSGNFSAVLGRDPLRLAITGSGLFKGSLTTDGILEIDERCATLRTGPGKPSAESLLHVELARCCRTGTPPPGASASRVTRC